MSHGFPHITMIATLLILATTSLLIFRSILRSSSTKSDDQYHQLPVELSTVTTTEGNDSSFCHGMFMTMSMSGFQWSLLLDGGGDCLTYFAPAWKLDDRGKFQGAMVYTFLMAILTEGLYTFPILLEQQQPRFLPKHLRHLVDTIVYGIQRFMGYIIMLIAMMYSWELFMSVVLGHMVGKLLFPNATRREWRDDARRRNLAPLPSAHPTLAATLIIDDETPDAEERDLLSTEEAPLVRRRR
jgi:Ctr copper transporter family